MAIYAITHRGYEEKYKRKDRIFFGVGDITNTEDFEIKYIDNISGKNSNYSELTAIYAIFKNKNDEFVGIEHYRRTFLDLNYKVITLNKIKKILKSKDIILPIRIKNDLNNYDFYCFNHYNSDFIVLREVIREDYPEYMDAFNSYFAKKSSYYFNMMICKKTLFDKYHSWLFEILAKCEKKIGNVSDRSKYQQRVYGFLSERLLNVWVYKNIQQKNIYHLPVGLYEGGKVICDKKLLRIIRSNLVNIFGNLFYKWK